MEIRIANSTDNLQNIAELIYETDPYIYPSISQNRNDAVNILTEMIKSNTLFKYDNCLIAVEKNNVVGLIVFSTVENKTDNEYGVWLNKNDSISYFINKYVKVCENQINENEIYLTCVCTNKLYRRKKVATKLIQQLFEMYNNKNFKLDVLQNNLPAINLYKTLGFEIQKEDKGYNKKNHKKPLIFSMVKKPSKN